MIALLKAAGEEEMADIYGYGIHDYANETYQEGADHPEEWLDETERVDRWISAHEAHIHRWLYELIMEHKSEVLNLSEN